MDEMRKSIINQASLTSECWSVQLFGLKHCKTCEFLNTKECGGENIRKIKRNSKGYKIID